jgi:hypothetical protein
MTRVPEGLPPADVAVTAARGGTRALDRFAPGIDCLADAGVVARWLGLARRSVWQAHANQRAGRPGWLPEPADTAGRSGLWSYRQIAVARARMPGRGSAGRGRPARR